jgi:hypothetical protein
LSWSIDRCSFCIAVVLSIAILAVCMFCLLFNPTTHLNISRLASKPFCPGVREPCSKVAAMAVAFDVQRKLCSERREGLPLQYPGLTRYCPRHPRVLGHPFRKPAFVPLAEIAVALDDEV